LLTPSIGQHLGCCARDRVGTRAWSHRNDEPDRSDRISGRFILRDRSAVVRDEDGEREPARQSPDYDIHGYAPASLYFFMY
jgi:hypothetical protein